MTVIIAVGCTGGRMVNRIIDRGRITAEYLAINTDWRVLEACRVGRKILIDEQRRGAAASAGVAGRVKVMPLMCLNERVKIKVMGGAVQ